MRNVLMILAAVAWLAGPLAAAENWPEFRGPTGQGHAEADNLPVEWSEQQNVAWKTPIHGRGWSTPVVWGDRVWLTTATPDGREMSAICVDRETGEVLFDKKIFRVADPRSLGNDVNGYASPSPVIEPGRVYVHFGSYGTACLDSETGEVIWQRRDLPCNHWRGPASSPILFENLLILTFDGADRQYLAALDKETGETVWKTPRSTHFDDLNAQGEPIANGDFRKAFNTPIIIRVDGRVQMISPGAKAVFAYDPRTGEEIWSVHYPGHSSAPRTLRGEGMVFVCTGFPRPEMWAIRPTGSGEVADSHVAWKYGKNVPAKPSPLLVEGRIYMIDDSGVASCIDAETGEDVWKARVDGSYSASPVYAGGRIYFFSEEGKTTVIAPGEEYKKLAENRLDSGFMASPAVAGDALFLRTRTHLYRIEKQK